MTFIKKSKVLIMSEIENLCFIESIKKSLVMFLPILFYILEVHILQKFALQHILRCFQYQVVS